MAQIKSKGSSEVDQGGRDPSIQSMRRVFARLEKAQTELLEALCISPLDQRLGPWRREALNLFEQKWVQTTKRGGNLDEGQIAALYYGCFTRILAKAGIPVPSSPVPADQEEE